MKWVNKRNWLNYTLKGGDIEKDTLKNKMRGRKMLRKRFGALIEWRGSEPLLTIPSSSTKKFIQSR